MKRSGFDAILRSFFETKNTIFFLIGVVVLALLGSGIYDALLHYYDPRQEAPVVTPIAIASGAFIAICVIAAILFWLTNNPAPVIRISNSQKPVKRRGIIVLVSNEKVALKAIEWHQPVLERCWLVQSSRSADAAKNISTKFETELEPLVFHSVSVVEAFDAHEVSKCITTIHASLPDLGFEAKDVIVDFTGMTSPASVGAVMGALSVGMPLQYTPSKYDKELQPTGPGDPVELKYNWLSFVPSDEGASTSVVGEKGEGSVA